MAAAAAALVLAALIVLPAWRPGGFGFAAGLLALQAGGVAVGGAVIIGAAVRSEQLLDRPADAEQAASLLRLTGLDGGDVGFFRCIVVVTVVLGGLARRRARRWRPGSRPTPTRSSARSPPACSAWRSLGVGRAACSSCSGSTTPASCCRPPALPVLVLATVSCWPHAAARRADRGSRVQRSAWLTTRSAPTSSSAATWRPAEQRRALRRDRPRHRGGHRRGGQRRRRRRAAPRPPRPPRPSPGGRPRRRASAAEVLRRSWELLTERADDLARLITLENGKVLAEAKGEITYAAEFFRWFSEEAVRLTRRAHHRARRRQPDPRRPPARRRRLPRHPVELPGRHGHPQDRARRSPPAARSCSSRPRSRRSPRWPWPTCSHEAGVPAGVVNVVPGRSASTITAAVLEHPRVRKLSFTGSTEVGKKLIEQAADRVLNVSMELGGNAPVHRARRRRPRRRHRGGDDRQDAPQRRDLHGRQPLLRGGAGRRGVRRQAGRRHGRAAHRPRARGGQPPRPARRRRHARQGRRARRQRRRRRRQGARRRRDARRHRLLLPGHRAHRRRRPTTRSSRRRSSDRWRRSCRWPTPTRPCASPTAPRWASSPTCTPATWPRASAWPRRSSRGWSASTRASCPTPPRPFGGVKESGIGREGGHEGMLDYTETKYIATDW